MTIIILQRKTGDPTMSNQGFPGPWKAWSGDLVSPILHHVPRSARATALQLQDAASRYYMV